MFLVTVVNAATKQSEQYLCKHIEFGTNMLGFPRADCKQVHLFTGILGRGDASITIETSEPVRVLSEKYLDEIALRNHPAGF